MNEHESTPVLDPTQYTQRSPITAGERYSAGIRHKQTGHELAINGSVDIKAAGIEAAKHNEDPRDREFNKAESRPTVLPRIGERALNGLSPEDMGQVPMLEQDLEIISEEKLEPTTTPEIKENKTILMKDSDLREIRDKYHFS